MNIHPPPKTSESTRFKVSLPLVRIGFLLALLSIGSGSALADTLFATKGFLLDSVGADGSAEPHFVGVRHLPVARGAKIARYQVAITDHRGDTEYSKTFSQGVPNGAVAGNPEFASGSAVAFNGLVYVFVSLYLTDGTQRLQIIPIDPNTWSESTRLPTLWFQVSSPICFLDQECPITKNGVAAVVADGSIYAFVGRSVISSSDGENWSARIGSDFSPLGAGTIIQDAVTFIDPESGQTRVLLVFSQQDTETGYPVEFWVGVFDPKTQRLKDSQRLDTTGLPLGENGSFNAMHASAWFGSWNTQYTPSIGCRRIQWRSGDTAAYLHVLGAIWTGSEDYLVHWYLDPFSRSWRIDPTGCRDAGANPLAMSWVGPCPGAQNRTPLALGPAFRVDTENCPTGGGCLRQVMTALSCYFPMDGSANPWRQDSDLWVPSRLWHGSGATPGPWQFPPLDTANAGDPAFVEDAAGYASLTGLTRLVGIVLGPPPFPLNPDWLDPADWAGISNVRLGQANGQSRVIQRFAASISAGTPAVQGPPQRITTSGLPFDTGYAGLRGRTREFSLELVGTMGSAAQDRNRLGRSGQIIAHAPTLEPTTYIATSAQDPGPAGTALGYAQTVLTVAAATDRSTAYTLDDPANPADPAAPLLAGLAPVPASTDIPGWAQKRDAPRFDWSNPGDGGWRVVAGPGGPSGIPELQLGPAQALALVPAATPVGSWAGAYATEPAARLRLGDPTSGAATTIDLGTGYGTAGESTTQLDAGLETRYQAADLTRFSELRIQPYLLQAIGPDAPWVPKGYRGPLPWAITWDVIHARQRDVGGSGRETVYGRSPPPTWVTGRITGVAAPPQPGTANTWTQGRPDDRFQLRGGRLSLFGADGALRRIDLAAADFDPALGVTLRVNGSEIRATGQEGRWRRSGESWTYTSRSGRPRLQLELDFRSGTWNMALARHELSEAFQNLGASITAVTLNLNQRYVLTSLIPHQSAYQWSSDLTGRGQALRLQRLVVRSEYSGDGELRLNGALGPDVPAFGDTSVGLNGELRHLPMMQKNRDFALRQALRLTQLYREGKSSLRFNPRNGALLAKLDRRSFRTAAPLHHGEAELLVAIGGKPYFKAWIRPDRYRLIVRHRGR